MRKYFPQQKLDDRVRVVINGTGKWEIGGPASDTGVTGRKIIVDTYGGMGRHGGGCFSGKDATKVDRSAAYGCRSFLILLKSITNNIVICAIHQSFFAANTVICLFSNYVNLFCTRIIFQILAIFQ